MRADRFRSVVAGADPGVDGGGGPLVGGAGVAEPTFWWQLRQQALYLSGVWSIGMMSLVMLLSLR